MWSDESIPEERNIERSLKRIELEDKIHKAKRPQFSRTAAYSFGDNGIKNVLGY